MSCKGRTGKDLEGRDRYLIRLMAAHLRGRNARIHEISPLG